MKITITGRKCTLRDSFKERVEKKLSKFDKFFGAETEAKVTATVEKNIKIVEITVLKDGMIFRAEEKNDDMVEAFDRCVDALVRKIRKNKTKLERKLRDITVDYLNDEFVEAEETDFEIVRTKKMMLKPETTEEAILQMNMLGHHFYMFINADTDEVNVVYKRGENGYGLLEPEIG